MQTTDNRHILSAMSNTPEISVCMPMYNAARYLRECIDIDRFERPAPKALIDGNAIPEYLCECI